jgi:hypothetical protein
MEDTFKLPDEKVLVVCPQPIRQKIFSLMFPSHESDSIVSTRTIKTADLAPLDRLRPSQFVR